MQLIENIVFPSNFQLHCSSNAFNGPVRCFNARKNWILGWYREKSRSVGSNWSGRLFAFVDYDLASVDRGEYVLLRLDDVYLQYNRAKGFNVGTKEHKDEVVLIQEEDLNRRPVHSVLLAGLGENQSFSRNGVTFEVCSLVFNVGGDYADLRIYPSGSPSTCSSSGTPPRTNPPTPPPTRLPTPNPTPRPTPSPTPSPTRGRPVQPTRPPTDSSSALNSLKVLVVRVIGDSGAEQPTESRDRLAGAVFGIGAEPLSNSMSAQYNRCSFGQLDFIPADGNPLISNGVLDLPLSFSLQGRDIYSSRHLFREETAGVLGVSSSSLETMFDHVMFCVASGTVPGTSTNTLGWSAFVGNSHDSYFNSARGRCDKLSALMFASGRELGLHFSGDSTWSAGDNTGAVRINAVSNLFSNECTDVACFVFLADVKMGTR